MINECVGEHMLTCQNTHVASKQCFAGALCNVNFICTTLKMNLLFKPISYSIVHSYNYVFGFCVLSVSECENALSILYISHSYGIQCSEAINSFPYY